MVKTHNSSFARCMSSYIYQEWAAHWDHQVRTEKDLKNELESGLRTSYSTKMKSSWCQLWKVIALFALCFSSWYTVFVTYTVKSR